MYTDLWAMFWLACTFVGPMHAQRRGANALHAWLLCALLGPLGVWCSISLAGDKEREAKGVHAGGLLGTMAEIGQRKAAESTAQAEARGAKLEGASEAADKR